MDWFDETDLFYTTPSSNNRPNRLPASWVAACLLYHLQSVSANGHSFMENVFTSMDDFTTSNMNQIASCLYPTLSLVNHSCDPQVFRTCCTEGVCFLTTLRPLAAGSEIFDAYIECFSIKSRTSRQEELNSRYLFQCSCEACIKDWPTLFDPRRANAEMLRCPQCSTLLRVTLPRCPRCKSDSGPRKYTRLVDVEVPLLMASVSSGQIKKGTREAALSVIEQLSSLVPQPATVWDRIQELFKMLIDFTQGSWSYEPWRLA